jgi:hypothetical protein
LKLHLLHGVALSTTAALMLTGGAKGADQPGRMLGKASAAVAPVQPRDLVALADWIASELGLPVVADLPRVAMVDPERLPDMRVVAATSATQVAATALERSPDLVAFYDDAKKTIYLPLGWSATSPAAVSILVHEMVHHIQNVAELSYPCPESREAPAFAAQAAWLARSGSNLADAFGIDPLTLLVRTRCMH